MAVVSVAAVLLLAPFLSSASLRGPASIGPSVSFDNSLIPLSSVNPPLELTALLPEATFLLETGTLDSLAASRSTSSPDLAGADGLQESLTSLFTDDPPGTPFSRYTEPASIRTWLVVCVSLMIGIAIRAFTHLTPVVSAALMEELRRTFGPLDQY